jgi:hypothetical protein
MTALHTELETKANITYSLLIPKEEARTKNRKPGKEKKKI